MQNKHSHRIVEKTAENRFLQHQDVDADEARTHHADADYAPPALPADGAPAADERRQAPDA